VRADARGGVAGGQTKAGHAVASAQVSFSAVIASARSAIADAAAGGDRR
jgi:hypothetical protein